MILSYTTCLITRDNCSTIKLTSTLCDCSIMHTDGGDLVPDAASLSAFITVVCMLD